MGFPKISRGLYTLTGSVAKGKANLIVTSCPACAISDAAEVRAKTPHDWSCNRVCWFPAVRKQELKNEPHRPSRHFSTDHDPLCGRESRLRPAGRQHRQVEPDRAQG